ncbi:MAG: pyridoxal phosphate-dependent aminotransferase [bacterium]|nr:pyridoxal phosphate-dependent aminotransferase [bacterium]
MMLSQRAEKLFSSPTLAITAKVKQMRMQGIDVIGFGAGEPDFDTPHEIKEAAIIAIKQGQTKYTPTSGLPKLKEAICHKLKIDNNLDYIPEEIIVSCGAKHSLFNAILSICNKDDEVIIPAPYWVSYPEMVKLADAVPIFVYTSEENSFKLTPQELRKNITKKTKAIIINSPSNPTGALYKREELLDLTEIALENNIFIISDEIYEKLIYDDKKFTSIASLEKEIKYLTITINGLSKVYSMTGWRIGYTAASNHIIKAMSNIQDHSTSCPNSIAQHAAIAALEGGQECVESMRLEFDKRRKYMVERLNNIMGINCVVPYGAFYVFPNVLALFGSKYQNYHIYNANSLAEYLLEEAKVAVVPGEGFGSSQNIRLSYATSMENIINGLSRIEEALGKLIKI